MRSIEQLSASLNNIERMVGEIDRKVELIQPLMPLFFRKRKAMAFMNRRGWLDGQVSIHLRASRWPKQAEARLDRVYGFNIHWIP